jgi:hypothetical protein
LRSEYIGYAIAEINKLNEAVQTNALTLSAAAFMGLLCSTLRSVKIPFEGDPVEGLQIMGILETHTIDFEQLIVLSLNEDTFSYRNTAGSFIPYHLRRAFGLPVQEQYDALYGYYFYRLLQRAERVRLLYNGNTEGVRSGEKSRYLRQLIAESGHKIDVRTVQYNIGRSEPQPITVAKTDDVMALLQEYLAGGTKYLSATSLQRFLECPLRFYFANIAGIRTPDRVAEDIDGRMLGNIFHAAMQIVYTNFLQKEVNPDALQALLAHPEALETLAMQQTAMVYFGSDTDLQPVRDNGKLWITAKIVQKYIRGALQYDMRRTANAPFVIKGLEQDVSSEINFFVNENKYRAQFKGRIDRIDRTADGTTVVVDYKSGYFEDKMLALGNVDALFGEDVNGQRKEIFQGLLYSQMLQNNDVEVTRIEPAFYFLRVIYQDDFDHRIKTDGEPLTDATPLLPQFAEDLQNLLSRIFDPQQSFCQTDDSKNCAFCEFAEICGRVGE